MATSSGPVSAIAAVLPEHSGSSYRIRRTGEGLLMEYGKSRASIGPVRREMSWFIGSGAKARSFLLSVKGFLFQSPIAWYTEDGKWDFAPGYVADDQPYLARPVLPGCLQCHASRIQQKANTQNGYLSPPFLEAGIGCERCHGPGSAHIKNGRDIVNPAKLDSKRRDSVCEQCHLSGEVRVNRSGKRSAMFTPGEMFSDYVAVFVRSGNKSGMKVTSHVENLADSACKMAAGDRLWCGSCHDPHGKPAVSMRALWYRSKCLTCHEKGMTCKESTVRRQDRADDCTSCHMPGTRVVDAEHVVYTDHSIPRRATAKRGVMSKDAPLVAFPGTTADARDEGMAYAIAGQRDRALKILTRSVSPGSEDGEALLYLAELLNQKHDRNAAIKLYERAVQVSPNQLTGSVSLGAIRMEQGRYEDAIVLWTDALRKNPALVLVRFHLARVLVMQGRRAEAKEVLETALEFNPAFQPARQALEQLGRTAADPDGQHDHAVRQ
ncbi:MAG TPA: tetratricopeptide repeat protein [Bryobacteraceae bacterium]|nr:tetratricopeptide repeat protein [Bryobacteraceae bacterium]